jgi:hypothetical protein
VTIATVEVHPLATLLQLSPFPPLGWVLAIGAAGAATTWSRVPLGRRTRIGR